MTTANTDVNFDTTTIAAANTNTAVSPWVIAGVVVAGCASMFMVPFVGTIARNIANRVVPLHTTFTVSVPGGVVSPPKG